MPDSVKVPLLNDLAPDGFFYGGHYVVEFDPDSLWYETSLTIAALALKQGVKTEYHVFQHPPGEAIEAFSKLGLDAKKLQEEGLLDIWDSYTDTLRYETEKKEKHGEDENLWVSTHDKPLNAVKSAARWAKRAKEGYTEQAKRWLHIDDNTAIFLQYNDEEVLIDAWRTGLIPYSMRAREAPHFLAFVKGVASEAFYTKYEAICDGIIDVKAQEQSGKIENYIRVRMLRGRTFDSTWHRLVLGDNGEVELVGAAPQSEQRRLAAIMFTDIVGYTALTQSNERLAMRQLERHRELIRPILMKHSGREVKTIGDAFLVEFGSALEATECAMEMQQALHNYNGGAPDEVLVRIGIHLGDVIHKDGDVYGDAVNIASRIEPLAKGGEICISQQVYDQVRNKVPFKLVKLEPHELKNVVVPIDVYRVELPWETPRLGSKSTLLPADRLAVLPFVSMSPDPNDEYFADGMTEELITRLYEVKGLEVIARTSVMNYKRKEQNIAQIGKELNVGSVIEGSVRKAGNKIRVSAQLINTNTLGHLWASRYDRDLEDIFGVQTDIAEQVAGALEIQLFPSERKAMGQKRTESLEAYTLYLKGRQNWSKRSKEGIEEAMACFKRASEIDPDFAPAYAGIADAYIAMENWRNVSSAEVLPKARQAVLKALKLDGNLAEARTTYASMLALNEWKWEEAEIEFKRAIELNPNYATAHQWYAYSVLRLARRVEEERREVEKAIQLDPLAPVMSLNKGQSLYFQERYDEAIEWFGRVLKIDPNFEWAYTNQAGCYIMSGRYNEGMVLAEKYLPRIGFPENRQKLTLVWCYGMAGRKADARRLLEEVIASSDKSIPPTDFSGAYQGLGETDKMFEWLELAYIQRDPDLPFNLISPNMKSYLSDLRLQELKRKVGI